MEETQLINREFPPCITACRPTTNEDAYLHVFHMTMKELNVLNEAYSFFGDVLNSKGTFGILTNRALPITPMPDIKVVFGTVHILFETNVSRLHLSEMQILQMHKFHVSLFKDVLNCLMSFITTDNTNSCESYYIVPLEEDSNMQGSYIISWRLVNNLLANVCGTNRILNYDSLKKGDVVTLWSDYDEEKPQNYLVYEKIPPQNGIFHMIDTFPLPSLADSKMTASFYSEYDSIRLMCLSCVKQHLPGSYWIKATILPVVLTYMNHSLMAIYLQNRLSSEAFNAINVNPDTTIMCQKNILQEKITVKAVKLHTISITNPVKPKHDDFLMVLLPNDCKYAKKFEKLQFLGNSFLRFAVASCIYDQYNMPDLSKISDDTLSNKNIKELDRKTLKLGARIQIYQVIPKFNWCPPGFSIPRELIEIVEKYKRPYSHIFACSIPTNEVTGILSDETKKQLENKIQRMCVREAETISQDNCQLTAIMRRSSQKTTVICDCLRVLVASHLVSLGMDNVVQLLKYLQIIKTDYNIFEYRTVANRGWTNYVSAAEEKVGYIFNDKSLLYEALRHSCQRGMKNYEKLEYFGDILIDFLFTTYLYEYHGDKDKHDIYVIKTSLSSNVQLAYKTIKLGLYKYMFCNCHLQNQTYTFAQVHGSNDDYYKPIYTIKTPTLKVAKAITVPKCLGDIFESVMAAIYFDSGKNLNTLWIILYNIMYKEIAEYCKNPSTNPKRQLYDKYEGNLPIRIYKDEDQNSVAEMAIKRGSKNVIYRGVSTNGVTAKQVLSAMILEDE